MHFSRREHLARKGGRRPLDSISAFLLPCGKAPLPHTRAVVRAGPRWRYSLAHMPARSGCSILRLAQQFLMRALIGLVVVAGVLLGFYAYSLKKLPATDSGTAPTQAISLTGVRSDLLSIANAERGNVALNSQCASLN